MNINFPYLINNNSVLFADKITQANSITEKFGITLSSVEAQRLIKSQEKSLKSHGRINFSDGIIHKLHLTMCDSPYVHPNSYFLILDELIETFYYFKSESLDVYSDDKLLENIRTLFDEGGGSIEYINDKLLEDINTNIKNKNN